MRKVWFWCARPAEIHFNLFGLVIYKRQKKEIGNDLVVNVAIQKIVDRATSTSEEDSSASEEGKHFQVREGPRHGCNCDGPAN